MEIRKIANLENPARRPCALGYGAISYVIDDGFCVLDYFRMEEHLTRVQGAVPLGAISSNVCSGNALALALFANERELYIYPLFLACDAPFENAVKEDNAIAPRNALQLDGNPTAFEPKHLASSLSRGEILFRVSGTLNGKIVTIHGAINHDPKESCDFVKYFTVNYADLGDNLVYPTPSGLKVAPAAVNDFDFCDRRFKRAGLRQLCVSPNFESFVVGDDHLVRLNGDAPMEKYTPFVGRNRYVLCQHRKTFLVTESAIYTVGTALECKLVTTIPFGADCVLFATGSEVGPDEGMLAVVSGAAIEFVPIEPLVI